MKYKLSDIFDLQMGKTPDRSNKSYWAEGTEPWISIADLTNSDKFIEKTNECIFQEVVPQSEIKLIPAHIVVMSFKLFIGKVAIIPRAM